MTLYELLTLRSAFGGDDRQQLLREICEVEPPAPPRFNSAIPKDLETIVLKAIAKEPYGRYSTASELGNELQRFLENKPIQARRTGRLDHLWRWAKRKPTMAALSATVLVLLLLLAIAGPLIAISSVTFSPDGRVLASAGRESAVRLWDPNTRELLGTIKGHTSEVTCVAFSPDGEMLATGSVDSRVRLWEVTAYYPEKPREVSGEWKTPVAFSPDGRHVAVSTGLWHPVTKPEPQATRIWELPSGQKRVLRDPNCSVLAAAFSSGGDILITGGQSIDSGEGQITLWNTYTGEKLGQLIGHQKLVWSLASSRVCDIVASGDDMGVVKVWDLRKRTARFSISTGYDLAIALAFSPHDQILAAAVGQRDGGVWRKNCKMKVWCSDTGQPVATLPGHRKLVTSADFSRNGTMLATGSQDGTIIFWNVATWLGWVGALLMRRRQQS